MFQESKSDSFRTKEWEFIRNVELYSYSVLGYYCASILFLGYNMMKLRFADMFCCSN